MRQFDLFDSEDLARQIALQKKLGWDLNADFPWSRGIDLNKHFVPLDKRNMEFPGASAEQKTVLSQLMGLIANEFTAQLESSLPRLKTMAWEKTLKKYPVNPEMFELGELFFAEEAKHAASFEKYFELFCAQTGIEPQDLRGLLPSFHHSRFQKAILWNAEQGGLSFWWVVAAVEEISIQVFRAIHKNKNRIDPLYYELHRKHTEEEARHENYAYMMLELGELHPDSMRRRLLRKTDLILAEILPGPWLIGEISKILRVKHLQGKHEFFDILVSCLPLIQSVKPLELFRRFYTSTPYLSWIVNPLYRQKHLASASQLAVPGLGRVRAKKEIDFKMFSEV